MNTQNMNYNEYAYLDLLKRKLDKKQKDVCFSTGNTIVAAGAGSGKTQVLATRFAWLVMSQKIPAPKILTLTFTNKAAGEMYERIYGTLSFFVENPATPEAEKKRALVALEEFSETHIQTLDSYCNSIVKQAANRYGIRPDFNAGGSDALEDIKNLALPYVFANKDRPCVQTFALAGRLENFAYDVLAKAVHKYTTLADPADFFVSKLPGQKQALLDAWNSMIGNSQIIDQFADACRKALDKNGHNEYIDKALTIDKLLAEVELGTHETFEMAQVAATKLFEKLKQITSIQFPRGGHTKELQAAKKLLTDCFINEILPLCSYIAQFEQVQDLYKMFDDFTDHVNASKRQTGNLTFADIQELALKILNEQEDIRIQEQSAYEKIMIDEFQDNNAKNKDLLFLLADGKQKLFFVGDEKQSIYKFRGADVSVFNNLGKELKDGLLLNMNYNYRSNNELLAAFNHVFGDYDLIFDNKTDKAFEAKYTIPAIKFNPATQEEIPKADITNAQNKKLSISLFDATNLNKEKCFDTKDQLAIHIAKQIRDYKNQMEAAGQKYPYSKFAILDRGRNDRRYLIKWLNIFNIPYTLDMNTSIFSDGPINDIYNFIKLCVYPEDKISMAGYLASPFANLSEESVEAILAGQNPQEWKDKEELKKYQTAMDFYENQRLLTLSRPLTKTLELLWNECGYRYETMLSYRKSLYAEQFDMLFELARQTDQNDNGIAWFTDQLGQIKDKEISSFGDDVEINLDELTYPIEKGDAVNIMTIHKSKGLQFDYVFVYGCTNVSSKNKDNQFFFDPELGLTIKPQDGEKNFFYLRQKERADQEELAEFRRLLYVAITRAENLVEIVGTWKEESDSSNKNDSFHLIENMVRWYEEHPDINTPFNFADIIPVERKEMKDLLYATGSLTQEEKQLDLSRKLYQTTEPAIKYEWPESNRKTPSSLETEYVAASAQDGDSGSKYENSEDLLTTTDFGAADFGTLVHAFLEAQANGTPCEQYEPAPKLLKNLGDQPEQFAEVLEECRKMCREFAASDLGRQLEESKLADRFYRAEWAFRMFLEGTIFTGSIDLIFENPDGTYTIVDYKSDKEIDAEKYRGQQECYRQAASLMLKTPAEKIDCWLYFLRHEKSVKL